MSQFGFPDLESPTSGSTLINGNLEPAFAAIYSGHKGNSRPSYVLPGMAWINDTTNPWVVNIYDGASDVIYGTINTTTHQFTPANAGTGDVSSNFTTGVDGEVVVQSGTGGKTLKRANGLTGFAKLIAGVLSAVSSITNSDIDASAAIALSKLAPQAANTLVTNQTASSAVPTAGLALAASQLAGRGSTGNIAPITLGTGLSMSGTTLNAAAGSVATSTLFTSLATAQTKTFAHGFGAKPTFMKITMVCNATDNGYSVGDEYNYGEGFCDSGANRGIGSYMDATNAIVIIGSVAPLMVGKSTGAIGAMTLSKWDMRITAVKL